MKTRKTLYRVDIGIETMIFDNFATAKKFCDDYFRTKNIVLGISPLTCTFVAG